jgi:hypothetical protein
MLAETPTTDSREKLILVEKDSKRKQVDQSTKHSLVDSAHYK